MEMPTVVEPLGLAAVIVWVVPPCISEGVPEMTPVAASNANPAGSSGLALHDVTLFLTAGTLAAIETPCV